MRKIYEVGYGKPPKDKQWPKGVSGNPGGREKGHKGLKTDLESAMNAVQTLENKLTGKKSKARNQLHAVFRLVERAALGDLKAQALLWPMAISVLGIEDRHTGARKMSAQDRAILEEILGERLGVGGDLPLLAANHGETDSAEGSDRDEADESGEDEVDDA
jgi:hypothetical protein